MLDMQRMAGALAALSGAGGLGEHSPKNTSEL
jgi:hypothetical protein